MFLTQKLNYEKKKKKKKERPNPFLFIPLQDEKSSTQLFQQEATTKQEGK